MYEIKTDEPFTAMELLTKAPFTEKVSLFGTNLHLSLRMDYGRKDEISAFLQKKGCKFKQIEETMPTLEDVFIHLVEEN